MKTLILIPPSEGKNTGGTNPPVNATPLTKELLKEIQKSDQAKLHGVKGKALEQAIAANKNALKTKTLPAIERYKGVVYNALDAHSLPKKSLDRLRIVSGLFGLIKPFDNIPEYKLKIDKLKAAQRWKPIIKEQLKDYFIIDLLPQAHKKAISYEKGMEVEFILKKNGKKVPAGHQGKYIKGRFVRWLLKNNIQDPKEFKKFTEDGYSWTGEHFLKSI